MAADDFDVIFVRDAEGRAMLGEIADFESRKTGRVNLSSTLHRVIVEEYERMKAGAEYKRWKKERAQT